jgi:hypothetical protein
MAIDLPPQMQERVVCSIAAATKYEVPANIVLAVAEKENGRAGQWVRNSSNGSYDVGALQFNTRYLQDLAKYGITAEHVAAAGCYSFELAAWRLRMHIKNDPGDLWTKASNYHSRTPQFNQVYRSDLIVRAAKWATWLTRRYATHSTTLASQPTPNARPFSVTQTEVATRPTAATWASPAYVPRKLIISENQ